MSTHFNLDPESFQSLLANAYVVQESGMDRHSLLAVIELQRSIANSDLELDRAMQLMADRARNVANAAGVAIALLKGDQLIYRAGSGVAATYVGRQLMAIMSGSLYTRTRCEILRVENAQTDTRIEAAICRQFGAESLLMVPIYHERALAGVMKVFFNQAHGFSDREVRTYRLMTDLMGETISHAARLERERMALAARTNVAAQPAKEKEVNTTVATAMSTAASAGDLFRRLTQQVPVAVFTARIEELVPALKDTWTRWMVEKRVRRAVVLLEGQKTALAASATLMVVLMSWMAYRGLHPRPVAAPVSGRVKTHQGFTPVTGVPINAVLNTSNAVVKPTDQALTDSQSLVSGGFKMADKSRWTRVVRKNQWDYESSDVTVRYFNVDPGPQSVPAATTAKKGRVHHFADDVTVRYFDAGHDVVVKPIAAGTREPMSK